jgi:multidrug transporter EmrE-like cation transporter
MPWLIPLAILILFEALADILAKTWSLKNVWWYGASALVAYLIANTFWLFALRQGVGLGRGAVIFSVVSAILAVVIGVVGYREHVNYTQLIGIVLGIIALMFIFWE